MKSRIVYTLVFLFALSMANGQSLEYFVDLAKENHPQIKAEELRLEAIRKQESQMTTWQDPVLSGAYNVVPGSMEKYSVSLMQNFSWFGTGKQQRAAARMAAESATVGLMALEKQLELQVSLLYLQVKEIEEEIILQEEMKSLYERLENLATNRLSSAQGSMIDVIRAEMAKENSVLESKSLQQRKIIAVQSLNEFVGREREAEVKTEEVPSVVLKEETGLSLHPEVTVYDSRIEENRMRIEAIRKESFPQWGIGVDYMKMEPDRDEFMPMLSISLPIFRNKYKARIAEAELLSEAYEFEKKWSVQKLSTERIRLRNEILQLELEKEVFEAQIKKAERARELMLNYYSTSGQDFQELLRIQQEELGYKQQLIRTENRLLRLIKEWEYFTLLKN